MKKFFQTMGVLVALVAGGLVVSPAAPAAASYPALVTVYQDMGYNIPCLRPQTGCWAKTLNWAYGNCATANSGGYLWKRWGNVGEEYFSSLTGSDMSSVKLVPGSGCNYIFLRTMSGVTYGQCVNNTGRGISWFGSGPGNDFNDNIKEVGAYYVVNCGGHL